MKYDIGCPACIKTTLIPILEASVLITKSWLNVGNCKTIVSTMACFKVSKPSVASCDQEKKSLHNKFVRGAIIMAYPWMKCR